MIPRRGTWVRVSGGSFQGLTGTADGYATMAGQRHVRVRLHDQHGIWVNTIYVLPGDLEKVT